MVCGKVRLYYLCSYREEEELGLTLLSLGSSGWVSSTVRNGQDVVHQHPLRDGRARKSSSILAVAQGSSKLTAELVGLNVG